MTMLDHMSDDRLLDLVNGLVSGAERQAVLDHARACAPCAERLRQFGAAHATAAALAPAALERAVHAVHAVDATATAEAPPAPLRVDFAAHARARHPGARPIARPRLAIAAAAVVVLGTATLFVWSALRPLQRPIPDLAWLPAPNPGILARGPAGSGDARILDGLAAYGRHDLLAARRLLEPVHTTGPLELTRRIYLANAQLRQGAAAAAVRTLRDVPFSEVPEPWRSQSLESMARALSATGQQRAADSVRRSLAQRADSIGNVSGGLPPEPSP